MTRFVTFIRRRMLLGLAAVALLAVALWLVWRVEAWGCVSSFHDKYQKVQPNMTLQEVKAILGRPTHMDCPGGSLGPAYCAWEDRRKTIYVAFDFLPLFRYGVVSRKYSIKPAAGWMSGLPTEWYECLCNILDDFGW